MFNGNQVSSRTKITWYALSDLCYFRTCTLGDELDYVLYYWAYVTNMLPSLSVNVNVILRRYSNYIVLYSKHYQSFDNRHIEHTHRKNYRPLLISFRRRYKITLYTVLHINHDVVFKNNCILLVKMSIIITYKHHILILK